MILLIEQHSQVFYLKEFKEFEPFDLLSYIFHNIFIVHGTVLYKGILYKYVYFKHNPPMPSCTLTHPSSCSFPPSPQIVLLPLSCHT